MLKSLPSKILAAAVCLLSGLLQPSFADTFTVINTQITSSAGSLVWAIQQANSFSGPDTINFNIPGIAPHTISLASAALPNLTDAGTLIDGTSQPGNGYTGDQPKIIVDGSQLGSGYGFYITGSACQLWGLFITGFPYHGVSVTSTGSGFVIGKSFKGNVISGNNEYGILVDGADNGYIQGNRIGSGADGITDLGNGYAGITLQNGADYNFIGGAGSAGNIISGNSYYGISIQCSSHNFIRGNKIGTDISGVVPLPNEYGGIYIGFSGSNYTCFATGNIVGGSNIGDENIIAYNFYYGVNICGDHVDFNTVSRNSIFCNGYGGLSLIDGNNGQPSGNDNFSKPIITTVSTAGASGTAAPNSRVELFLDDNCLGCQGMNFLATVLADGSGNWSYTGTLNGTLTATATDVVNGNTSSFADCAFITANLPPIAAMVGLPAVICAGDCVAFNDYSWNFPSAWQWTFTGGNPSSSSQQNPGSVCYNLPGNYDVQLVVSNTYGTDTLILPDYINVSAIAGNAVITTGGPYCTTDGLQTFTASASGGTWYGTGIVDSVNGIFDPAVAGVGTFTISYSYSATGSCSFFDTAIVIVENGPVADFFPSAAGNVVSFTNNSLYATDYSWQFGDGGTSNLASPTHTYLTNGTFTITLIASNNCGADTMSITIKVFETGIEEFVSANDFSVYPNPSEGIFHVVYDGSNSLSPIIILQNINGQKVLDYHARFNPQQRDMIIDAQNLPAGIYNCIIEEKGIFSCHMTIVKK